MRAEVAVLTAPTAGAIAVLSVRGPDALAVVDRSFRPNSGRPFTATPPGRPRLGRIGRGLGDEVVAVASDPEAVEIHCHGGTAAVALVRNALADAGATPIDANCWFDASVEMRARHAAARAATLRAADVLLEQADGALRLAIERFVRHDDRPELDRLIGRAAFGRRLLGGWAVALAGRPNVGKSALMNALAGFDRAIVADEPGTTRDAVTWPTAFGGWPAELIDTAGLRATDDPTESAGVALARNRHRNADLVLLMLDGSEPLTSADDRLLAEYPEALRVVNKADLPPRWSIPDGWQAVSALTGAGIAALADAIGSTLVPDPPLVGAGVPWLAEQEEVLRDAATLADLGDSAAARSRLASLFGFDDACST